MKKLMTLAALVAACAPAFTAEVESSNVVGYQKLNLVNGLNLVSAPFVAVGSGDIDINDSLSSADMKTGTTASFWDSTLKKYTYVFYYDENSEGGVYTDGSYEECLGPGWGDIDQIAIDYPLVQGEGFWVQSEGASVNVFAGEVSTNAVNVSLISGLNLVGNPFPAPLPIQKITGAGLKTGTTANIWNPTTKKYSYVFYYDENSEGGVYTDGSYEECLGPGWGDIDQVSVDTEIDSLAGFWIQSETATNITIEY